MKYDAHMIEGVDKKRKLVDESGHPRGWLQSVFGCLYRYTELLKTLKIFSKLKL